MRASFSFLFASLVFVSTAQLSTTHPLSSFGIGEYNTGSNAISTSLGTVNTSMIDSTLVNYFNPSSYTQLSKGNTLLSMGLESKFSSYSQGNVSEFKLGTTVTHVALAMKINKLMGISFGLKPYSKMGYEFSENQFTGIDSIRYTYKGTGNMQDAYFGYAISPIRTHATHFSIGFNGAYLFGFVGNERKSELLTDGTGQGGMAIENVRLSSFHYEIGAHFEQKIGVKQKLLIAFNMDPTQRFNGRLDNELYTSSTINTPSTYDTISFSQKQGNVQVLQSYEAGLRYQFFFRDVKRKSNTRRPNLTILASYKKWNGVNSDFGSSDSNWNVGSSDKWSFGLSYSPETKLFENVATLKLFEKLSYRCGLYYLQTPFSSNGSKFIDRGTTFGIGFPILAQMSLSSLNLAFVIGQKSTESEISLKENYLGFKFGMVFSPSAFEKWFRKRKLD